MSALLPKADMFSVGIDVRYVPNADIQVCNIFATVEPRNRDIDHFCSAVRAYRKRILPNLKQRNVTALLITTKHVAFSELGRRSTRQGDFRWLGDGVCFIATY